MRFAFGLVKKQKGVDLQAELKKLQKLGLAGRGDKVYDRRDLTSEIRRRLVN